MENAVQAFLNREWEAQSHRERPFRITASVVEGLGFVLRRHKGSHRIYRHGGRSELPLVNLQEGPGGKAKPYQVRQVLSLIETYGLEIKT